MKKENRGSYEEACRGMDTLQAFFIMKGYLGRDISWAI
jgi:hypothetical protein